LFDEKFSFAKADSIASVTTRSPIKPFPQSPLKPVPPHIVRPPYAATGQVPYSRYTEQIVVHDAESADLMRHAARLARQTLDLACSAAEPGVTSDEVDTVVHEAIIAVRETR
jgi:methionyl aminopeptidase